MKGAGIAENPKEEIITLVSMPLENASKAYQAAANAKLEGKLDIAECQRSIAEAYQEQAKLFLREDKKALELHKNIKSALEHYNVANTKYAKAAKAEAEGRDSTIVDAWREPAKNAKEGADTLIADVQKEQAETLTAKEQQGQAEILITVAQQEQTKAEVENRLEAAAAWKKIAEVQGGKAEALTDKVRIEQRIEQIEVLIAEATARKKEVEEEARNLSHRFYR